MPGGELQWSSRQPVTDLLRYTAGTIDDISGEMRVEVGRARWIPLEDGPKALQYSGEKQMARKALEFLRANPET